MEAAEYTYEDAARACGVSTEAIRQRARRGKLRRGRPTNTGRPTVLLTEQDIAAISTGRPFAGQPDGQPAGALQAAVDGEAAALRDALDRERQRADRAEEQAAEARSATERQSRELTASLLRTAIAETEARVLRDALAEARRPAWRRWLGY